MDLKEMTQAVKDWLISQFEGNTSAIVQLSSDIEQTTFKGTYRAADPTTPQAWWQWQRPSGEPFDDSKCSQDARNTNKYDDKQSPYISQHTLEDDRAFLYPSTGVQPVRPSVALGRFVRGAVMGRYGGSKRFGQPLQTFNHTSSQQIILGLGTTMRWGPPQL